MNTPVFKAIKSVKCDSEFIVRSRPLQEEKKKRYTTLIQTLQYFYIPVSGQLQLWKPFSRPQGPRSKELPLYGLTSSIT